MAGSKVVTFGEIMLRLAAPNYQRLVQVNSFDAAYAGGEANVAVSLAQFGMNSYYVTKVPDNPLGYGALGHLQRYGVKTDYVIKGGKRLGIYFVEAGASQRPSMVIYDRASSAIAEAKPGEFDWKKIFDGAEWFHFTGITPALSDTAAALTLEALKVAKEYNITVSCDLNYRKKLWTPEKANAVMSGLMPYVDICIGNEEDAANTFGIELAETDVVQGKLNVESYLNVAEELKKRFGFKYVATSLRESYSASDNGWSVLLYDGEKMYHSKKYNIHIVDRVGGGDSCAAALIYALMDGRDLQDCVEFAAAASCLKHTIPQDFNLVTIEEVERLKRGDASGRVQR